jgi:hypothetical protein
MPAYWISPKGEMIDVKGKHINAVIERPQSFGFNKEFIEFMYDNYGEKIGQEGKAREQIMGALFKQNWIRIRKYKNFWTMNLKVLAGSAKSNATQWAKKVLKGIGGFKEQDPYIPVKIDQKGQSMKTIDLQTMSQSDKFVLEYKLVETDVKDMDSLPLLPIVNEMMGKRRSFKEYLNED